MNLKLYLQPHDLYFRLWLNLCTYSIGIIFLFLKEGSPSWLLLTKMKLFNDICNDHKDLEVGLKYEGSMVYCMVRYI